ncbi:unnamed protein product [Nezara viridula]|uniref:Uncharacterized protein n=1 Tax=Nezara viridula TaxID=85310 RepID=A0A9P0HPL2_NEZVI|nr:unnamed protein product [Nezara viridula]
MESCGRRPVNNQSCLRLVPESFIMSPGRPAVHYDSSNGGTFPRKIADKRQPERYHLIRSDKVIRAPLRPGRDGSEEIADLPSFQDMLAAIIVIGISTPVLDPGDPARLQDYPVESWLTSV